jgi:hypothetical protein
LAARAKFATEHHGCFLSSDRTSRDCSASCWRDIGRGYTLRRSAWANNRSRCGQSEQRDPPAWVSPSGGERIGGQAARAARTVSPAANRTSIIYKAPKRSAPVGMLELAQRIGLDLADPFAGDRELINDFGKRMIRAHSDAEAHADNALFARAERDQRLCDRVLQI